MPNLDESKGGTTPTQSSKDPFKGKYERDDGTYSPEFVNRFHNKADRDVSPTASHHTLGPGRNQAASGKHTHNGSDSVKLLSGTIITGARGGNTAVASIISALVKMGATDQTTA